MKTEISSFSGGATTRSRSAVIRIELGEIEAALRTHDSVRHAAVLLRNDGAANQLLTAYVVPREGKEVVQSELRRHLKTKLPDYMVPSTFVTMDALPLTPNGKLDQRALPAFDLARPQTPRDHVPPRNELEETLVEIWAEVLKIEKIGVLDNFFELGGHSLLAAKVIARVRKYLGVEVPLRDLFEEPTVAGLGRRFGKTTRRAGDAQHPDCAPTVRTTNAGTIGEPPTGAVG